MDTRRKILDAAQEVFSQNGYYMATMDMIAEKAGVAKGTLYYNFPSKVSLFTEVIKEGFRYIGQRLNDIAYSEYSPDRQVLNCINFFIDYCVENSSFVNILFFELTGSIDKEIRDVADGLIRELADIVANVMKEGMIYSVIRSMDADIASYALLGAMQGVMGRYVRGKEKPDVKKIKDNVGKLLAKGLLY
ncbi:MAG: TetR/AcrR family transcriptional regulator [Clostridia bacterium]